MNVGNVNSQVSFSGKLYAGKCLSSNLEKMLPEIEDIIKNKPYDLYITVSNIHRKNGVFHRTTRFQCLNSRFLKNSNYNFITETVSTNKSKTSTYTNVLRNLMSRMDKSIEIAQSQKEKPTFKEKFIRMINKIFIEG